MVRMVRLPSLILSIHSVTVVPSADVIFTIMGGRGHAKAPASVGAFVLCGVRPRQVLVVVVWVGADGQTAKIYGPADLAGRAGTLVLAGPISPEEAARWSAAWANFLARGGSIHRA